jgi:hypothetical protein
MADRCRRLLCCIATFTDAHEGLMPGLRQGRFGSVRRARQARSVHRSARRAALRAQEGKKAFASPESMDVKPVIAIGIGVLACAARAHAAEPPARSSDSLVDTVRGLDTAVFDWFNRCSDPAQLARHAAYFAEDVEFDHDNGGVTRNRDDMLARTRDNACGAYRRELVEGTLDVLPIKGFGAIAAGMHRLWESSGSTCDGLADFTMT